MEFITSRRNLPSSKAEMGEPFWFNMWKKKLWPYEELNKGDTLYWYESGSKKIVWKTTVLDVDRFSFNGKEEARQILKKRFGEFDDTQPYYVSAPSRGFCVAFIVNRIQRLNLVKPVGLNFPREGWVRVDVDIAKSWLKKEIDEDYTLDRITSYGTPIERLHQLNAVMADLSPQRIKNIVSQTIRNDTQLVKALKELCHFRCQFPNCNVRILKKDGGYYIEVAHIEPVLEGGRSVLGNLLVLCPNHHKEFDYGDLEIIEQTTDNLRGKLNGKEFEISLPSA